jgi:3-oxoacyl-[acyl-carrier-protein] synthase-3
MLMLTGATTLERIESFLPEPTVTIADLSERLGLKRANVEVLTRIQGLRELHYDPESSLFDLVLPAACRAVVAVGAPSCIRYLIYVHATQAVTPPDVDAAQVIKRELGLDHAQAFALTHQNCAGAISAVDVAGHLLRADGDPDARALMVTGEKPFTPEIHLIRDTTVFGEAGGACLVGVGGPGDEVLSYAARTLGRYSGALRMDYALAPEMGEQYTPGLVGVIHDALDGAGLKLSDIELVIPHNVNAQSWREIAKALGIDRSRVFMDNIPRTSHCFTSDLFVNYATLAEEGRLVPGRHYCMAAVGIGTTFTALVFTHRGR